MPRICGVYLITNTTNGKLYVGSSVHVQNRWGQHRHDLRRGRHDNGYLQRAWNKYGEAAFEFSLVTQSAPEALLDWEQAWLDVTQCYERNKGYNLIQYAAHGTRGYKHSAEICAAVSARQRGYKQTPEHIEARVAPLRGRAAPHSAANAVKARAAFALKGFTPEHRARLSAACKGRPCSPETREKIAAAQRGKPCKATITEETRRKLRAASAKGQEVRRQNRVARRGVTQ